jgi:pectate lyase
MLMVLLIMRKNCILLFLILLYGSLFAQQIAFPGADGYGKLATGGRNGSVYHVTNLTDIGPGSFRDAVSQPKRTVVFDVSGVINIKSKISVSSEITIAGQTAPGDGITVYGDGISISRKNNVIVRYMRFRGSINMGRGTCTLAIDSSQNVIVDHVSIEWGRWDNLHIKESKDVTQQYCIVGEALDPQRFGALLERPTNLTVHHCLWINNQSRNPKAKAGIEYVNNVIYNWGGSGFVGGHSAADSHQDLINNYFIAGPSSSNNFLTMFTATDHVFHQGNLVDLDKDGILNGRPITDDDFIKQGATLEAKQQNVSMDPKSIQKPEEALKVIVSEVGVSLHRDVTDNRLIGFLKSLGKTGAIVKSEAEVGGQVAMNSVKGPIDTDGDGIPDSWETAHKLNPANAADGSKMTTSGYTNLEKYLNGLVEK